MSEYIIPPDTLQRERALDITQSFIVQAPAGSGKTELLTRRYLSLLTHVNMPEEIVAITFTRKAASEMRARIVNTLQLAYKPEPSDEHAKKSWGLAAQVVARSEQLQWRLLQNPNRLRVMTIDALCASIVRQMPVLSTLGMQPKIADNTTKLYRHAVNQLLLHLEDKHTPLGLSISNVFSHFNNDFERINELLIAMLACREQWLPYAANSNLDELRIKLEKSLAAIISDHLNILVEQAIVDRAFSSALPLIYFMTNNLALQNTAPIIEEWPDAEVDSLFAWQQIADLFLTKEGEWRKRFDKNTGLPPEFKDKKAQINALVENLKDNTLLLETLNTVRTLPEPSYYADNWSAVKNLLAVLRLLIAELRLQFGETNQVDFIEVAYAALLALGTYDLPSDLLLSLDSRIQHLLVDEFQDTSALQFKLLEKLTLGWEPGDGRSLFLVGDPMQSIYRFRQAEVGLFIKACQEGIGSLTLEPLQLTANFRSSPSLVEWVNRTFASIFPAKNNISSGAVSYAASHAVKKAILPSGMTVHAHFNTKEANENILSVIQTLLNTPQIHTIAILVRARKHAATILPLLRAVKIPYQAVEIEKLVLQPVIQDLLALTKALLFPADRTAWFALLRAPWSGLPLTDLLLIAQTQRSGCLWPAILQTSLVTTLSVEGQAALRRIIPTIKIALEQRSRFPLRQWIEHTWVALGGTACLEHYTEMTDCQAFFELLEKASHGSDLPDFPTFEEQLAYCYSSPVANEHSRISVMTIHKSKGLEFDAVLLPALEERPRHDESDVLVWMDQPRGEYDNDLLLATRKAAGKLQDKMYTFIRRQEKRKTDYENARVLYVAATRSKQQLHLLCTVECEPISNTLKQPPLGSFLALLWDSVVATIRVKNNDTVLEPSSLNKSLPSTSPLHRLTSTWKLPEKIHTQAMLASPQNNNPTVLYKQEHERKQGIVLHRLFHAIAVQGQDYWLALPEIEKTKRISLLCHAEGLSVHAEVLTSINRAIENIFNDQHGQWLLTQLQSHTARMEYPISTMEKGELKHFILDATFIDEHGVRWIIDYKTAEMLTVSLEDFLNQQKELHTAQLNNYAQIMQHIGEEPIKLALYFPMVPAWVEW